MQSGGDVTVDPVRLPVAEVVRDRFGDRERPVGVDLHDDVVAEDALPGRRRRRGRGHCDTENRQAGPEPHEDTHERSLARGRAEDF